MVLLSDGSKDKPAAPLFRQLFPRAYNRSDARRHENKVHLYKQTQQLPNSTQGGQTSM